MLEALDLSQYAPDRPQIAKVRYTHDSMIDLIVANPALSQAEIAITFGYSQSWVSTIFASDAFQARLAARKDEIVDPAVRATLDEKFKALVFQSFEVLQKKLELSPSDDLALGVLKAATTALGYGASKLNVNVNQNNFVVRLPSKEQSSDEWAESHAQPAIPGTGHRIPEQIEEK